MSKLVKELITSELAKRYQDQNNAVWVELIGVDGNTTNAFRHDLRAKEMRLEVIKTALFKRACGDGPLAKLAAALEGPAALVTGGETAIDVAKLLAEWAPKFPKNAVSRLRGAILEGEYLDEEAVQGLHRMAGKKDLQARIAGIVLAPGGNVVAAVLSSGNNIAGCLKALIEKLEKGEEIARKSA
ncbi:MAG: 50S ribosomal protein L10 [Phycisphaerae bacterium]|nr:50S ribosomal protein L10 [Phycisphaerae bacterium]